MIFDNYTTVGSLVLVTPAVLVQGQTFSTVCESIRAHLYRIFSRCQGPYLKQGLI